MYHSIYKEIGKGQRVALSKFCVEHYERTSRPFRLAIDISIWLFQIQAGKGGSNPALRTFYYRLLRLLTLNIHPLFVFDGPNKPAFKRHKRVGGPHVKVSSIPEFLARQLLKQFAFPIHVAPGEAEAECALLQSKGLVDAVLTEDVDALMFGSGLTLRSWTPEAKKSKTPTHVNIYDATITLRTSGLDSHGMILVAMMSGGDYLPEGIPGCGPKTAVEAARAGFGKDLIAIQPGDDVAYAAWRSRLRHELTTNEGGFFRQKRKALVIPDDFPNRQVLKYYTNPCVSAPDSLARLQERLQWDQPLDLPSLRAFTADAFDWTYLDGAKKFIRNLAPALLVRELRLRSERHDNDELSSEAQVVAEAKLVTTIHSKRNHASTDESDEIRISYLPTNLVDIDLSIEEVNEEPPASCQDTAGDDLEASMFEDDESANARGPYLYDPTTLDKLWIMSSFLRLGVPRKVRAWEEEQRAKKPSRKKPVTKSASITVTTRNEVSRTRPITAFTQVTKRPANLVAKTLPEAKTAMIQEMDLTASPQRPQRSGLQLPTGNTFPKSPNVTKTITVDQIDLTSVGSPAPRAGKRRSEDAISPATKARDNIKTPKAKRFAQQTIVDLLTPSPKGPRLDVQTALNEQTTAECDDLPDTVSVRRRRSPFRRHHTAPEEASMLGNLGLPSPNLARPTTPKTFLHNIEAIDLASTTPAKKGRSHATGSASLTAWLRSPTTDRTLAPREIASPAQVDLSTESVLQSAVAPATSADAPPAVATHQNERSCQSSLPVSDERSAQRRTGPVIEPNKESLFGVPKQIRALAVVANNTVIQDLTATMPTAESLRRIAAPPMMARKKHIMLRESLDGAWKEMDTSDDVEVVSGPTFVGYRAARSAQPRSQGPSRRIWRQSEVEIMDLTAQ